MFDRYVFTEDSCRNYSVQGKEDGFELSTLITYYRGVPMSMIHDLQITADGASIPRENILFSTDREIWFTLDELTTAVNDKWEYGQQGWIRVKKEGGLGKGIHEISLTVAIRTAYMPVPFSGTRISQVKIA
jgi:hypothetical protein